MKSKQILMLLAAAAAGALSANATLFVTTGPGGDSIGQNAGFYSPGPYTLIFTLDSAATVDLLGAFDQGASGLGADVNYRVSIFQFNVDGAIATAEINNGSSVVSENGGNWRMSAPSGGPVSLSASVTYALHIHHRDALGHGLYNDGTTYFDGYSNTAGTSPTGNVAAAYPLGINVASSGFYTSAFQPAAGNVGNAVFLTSPHTDTGAAGTQIRGATFNVVVVPEPETYALIAGAGLLGFGLWRRRASKA